MTFDLSALLDVSHFAAFLGGTIVGCAGQYFADRFTDRRRRQEARSAEHKQFANLRASMPKLFEEMKRDLENDAAHSVREFVIVPNRRVSFNSSKPRFIYYEDDHPNVRIQADRLLDAGYIDDVTVGNAPIYRMREHFVALVREEP
jgi:hypothetical protein